MRLPRDGQEYVHITFSDLPFNVPVEVSIDDRATWHPTIAGATANERRVLISGPGITNPAGLPVVADVALWVRVKDTPETVIRSAGQIFLS